MSKKRSLYLVPKTLDTQTRVFGLPIDEFLPAAFFAVLFFMLGKVILSILISFITVIAIKGMKRGQGSAWLISLCYWYLPKCATKPLLRYTPASQNREYIA